MRYTGFIKVGFRIKTAKQSTGIYIGKVLVAEEGARFKQYEYEECKTYQRMNHFQNTGILTRKVSRANKDTLFRMLKTMKGIYGSMYDFFPVSFCVPTEYKKFVRHLHDDEEAGRRGIWICKPTDLSRGRGISVFRQLHELVYESSSIVQKYIDNPLLISNYKFDLRCYVLVRSYHPLVVYFYDEGLARFATVYAVKAGTV
jgi:tubulin polyglutamylase TTLL2